MSFIFLFKLNLAKEQVLLWQKAITASARLIFRGKHLSTLLVLRNAGGMVRPREGGVSAIFSKDVAFGLPRASAAALPCLRLDSVHSKGCTFLSVSTASS